MIHSRPKSESDRSRSLAGQLEWLIIWGGLLCALFVIVGRIANLDNFTLNVWGDRDLWRGLEMASNWNGTGPETNSGMRPFGGFFYILLHGAFSIWDDPRAANLAVTVLFGLTGLSLVIFAWRMISPHAATFAGVVLAGAGLTKTVSLVWNPGFIMFFAGGVVVFTCLFALRHRAVYLGLALFFAALGAQIHLQITILTIAIPAVMAVCRIHPRFSHLVAVLLGITAAYLPSIIGDPSSLGALTEPSGVSAKRNIDAYMRMNLAGLATRVGEIFTNYYFASGGSVAVIEYAVPERYRFVLGFLRIADIVAAGLVLRGAFAAFLGTSAQLVTIARVLLTFTVVAAIMFMFSTVNFRHFAFIIPVLALLAACGTEDLRQRLSGRFNSRIVTAGGFTLVLGILCARPLVLGGADFGRAAFNPASFLAHREIAEHVKSHYFTDYDQFWQQTVLFTWNGTAFELVPASGSNRMATVYEMTKAEENLSQSTQDCIAIFAGDKADTVDAEAVISRFFPDGSGVQVNPASRSTNLRFIPYSTAQGNCLKTFPNAYIASPFEDRYLKPRIAAAEDRTEVVQAGTDSVVFTHQFAGNRFPIAVEFIRSGGILSATLHGRRLRGHTGLIQFRFYDADINLDSPEGTYRIDFADTGIGDSFRGHLAPWQASATLPPEGSYALSITATDRKGQPFRIDLGTLTVSPRGISGSAPVRQSTAQD
jgi:hypothetical protein